MDNIDKAKISKLINNCVQLRFLLCALFPADSFPKLFDDSFIVVNASKAAIIGTHWLLICKKVDKIYFTDPLGNSLEIYVAVFKRVNSFYGEVIELCTLMPIQKTNSKLCGLFCIYIAHLSSSNNYPYTMYMNDDDLLQFAKHMLYFIFNSSVFS